MKMDALFWVWRALFLVLVGLVQKTAAEGKWSYSGDAGPSKWHEIFPKTCSGSHQSPIDIRSEETAYDPGLKDFAIYYDPPKPNSNMTITNNGHTAQVDLEGDFFVTNGGLSSVYKAFQFHFHWGHKEQHGSEHLIDGQAYPIEMHLVTYNHQLFSEVMQAVVSPGGLAVLGTMYEISEEDNPSLAIIVKALKHIRSPEIHEKVRLPLMSIRDLLPKDTSRYYRYNGSLTTPGCFESVTWTVFEKKQTISLSQLREFTKLLQHKHYHGRHHKGEASRHRRSMTKTEKDMEHRAEHVLDELGIRGKHFEEAVLRAEVMQMMSDMPQDDNDKVEKEENNSEEDNKETEKDNHASKEHNEEDKEEDHHKEKDNAKEDEDHAADTNDNPEHKKDHAEHHGSEEKKSTEEVHDDEYTQEVMVNNFRPVQPLNDRIVYRSFKLQDKSSDVLEDEEEEEAVIVFQEAQTSDNNRAMYHVLPLPAIMVLSILTLIIA